MHCSCVLVAARWGSKSRPSTENQCIWGSAWALDDLKVPLIFKEVDHATYTSGTMYLIPC